MDTAEFTPNVPKVYTAIVTVTRALCVKGITKDRKNEQQGYKFRGIDDVYNALAPLLADSNLCVLPRMLHREMTERQSKSGGILFYVIVTAEFDFVSAEDGSRHTVGPMYGEAMDSGDKATNKAMSAAYKYAMMEAFSIPTEGDNDADRTTHEVVKNPAQVLAERFLAALEDESDTGMLQVHEDANSDEKLYREAWKRLSASERSSIKAGIDREKARKPMTADGKGVAR